MLIRPARENDIENVRRMYVQAVGSKYSTWNEYYPGERELSQDFETGNLYVAEKDGTVIGAVSVVPENELDAENVWDVTCGHREIARVVIDLPYRGKGLSGDMVRGMMSLLKAQGCTAVHLSAAVGNLPAVALYRSLGFRILGQKAMYGSSYYLCEKKL